MKRKTLLTLLIFFSCSTLCIARQNSCDKALEVMNTVYERNYSDVQTAVETETKSVISDIDSYTGSQAGKAIIEGIPFEGQGDFAYYEEEVETYIENRRHFSKEILERVLMKRMVPKDAYKYWLECMQIPEGFEGKLVENAVPQVDDVFAVEWVWKNSQPGQLAPMLENLTYNEEVIELISTRRLIRPRL